MLKRTPLKRNNLSLKKTPLKKSFSPIKKCNKSIEQLEEDKLKKEKNTQFYIECRENVGMKSMISGDRLRGTRFNYHHTKPKSQYPEVAYCFLLILACTEDEHMRCENDSSFYKENMDKIKFGNDNWELCKELSKEWEINYESKNKINDI